MTIEKLTINQIYTVRARLVIKQAAHYLEGRIDASNRMKGMLSKLDIAGWNALGRTNGKY